MREKIVPGEARRPVLLGRTRRRFQAGRRTQARTVKEEGEKRQRLSILYNAEECGKRTQRGTPEMSASLVLFDPPCERNHPVALCLSTAIWGANCEKTPRPDASTLATSSAERDAKGEARAKMKGCSMARRVWTR